MSHGRAVHEQILERNHADATRLRRSADKGAACRAWCVRHLPELALPDGTAHPVVVGAAMTVRYGNPDLTADELAGAVRLRVAGRYPHLSREQAA